MGGAFVAILAAVVSSLPRVFSNSQLPASRAACRLLQALGLNAAGSESSDWPCRLLLKDERKLPRSLVARSSMIMTVTIWSIGRHTANANRQEPKERRVRMRNKKRSRTTTKPEDRGFLNSQRHCQSVDWRRYKQNNSWTNRTTQGPFSLGRSWGELLWASSHPAQPSHQHQRESDALHIEMGKWSPVMHKKSFRRTSESCGR